MKHIDEFYQLARFEVGSCKKFAAVNRDLYEKFAKLILFECIKLATFRGDPATAKAIKEHFGEVYES